MNDNNLAEKIAKLRKEKGLTQSQLAEMINVSNKTISRWETGEGYPEITLVMPLAKALGVRVNKPKFQGEVGVCEYKGKRLILLKPQTYMNASGLSVEPCAHFYKIPPERIIVIFDDISLPVGRIRVRKSGSAGGHNGIKSIIASLGTDAFPRVKVGVGDKPHPDYDLADWVLSAIAKEDQEAFGTALHHAAEAVLCIVENGTEKAAAAYNGK